MALPDRVYQFSDGEQLAFLEWQGDQPGNEPSVSVGSCAGCGGSVVGSLFGIHADRDCTGVPGFRRDGAAGVFVEQGPAACPGWAAAFVDFEVATTSWPPQRESNGRDGK